MAACNMYIVHVPKVQTTDDCRCCLFGAVKYKICWQIMQQKLGYTLFSIRDHASKVYIKQVQPAQRINHNRDKPPAAT